MTVYGGTTQTYYYVKDHLSSVQAIVDSTGSIVESYQYDAWGNVLGVYDSAGSPIPQSAVSNRFLWQGREYSWKTRLHYFRARWYDPVTGRWLSNDPIGISGGLNQYVFCGNNPINWTDPYGQFISPWGWAGAVGDVLAGSLILSGKFAPGLLIAAFSIPITYEHIDEYAWIIDQVKLWRDKIRDRSKNRYTCPEY